eukprot:CAMPEP_0194362620 /NCGR_PEP_ID=MMETSP0174-20130528/10392_1 /TAXON_ID=216777 /ORGANISM="Proboscia alata, Strain PI-D3" /LENGTH=203 /DNA_ID=CAMNT_0039135601 /DNA_START=79 /DNA_END=690 /DNA_ORIENTATION=-
MSDARNSSNNIRGGGAKQTGGSGRTNKYAAGGSSAKADLLGLESSKQNDRSEAKRKLQLQITSKQLAASIREKLLEWHTQEEYDAHDIPLPSTDDAKSKLKAMKEFTQNWYDKDFREEWLQTVTEVWLEELKARYEAAVEAALAARNPKKGEDEGEAMTIEELQELIQNLDVNVPAEERQRLKKKLKRKKQKQKEKAKKEAQK